MSAKMRGAGRALVNILFKLKMLVKGKEYIKYSLQTLSDPAHIQQQLLFSILQKNKHTTYGKKYNFYKIKNLKDYSRAVPINEYESLRPYIDKQRKDNSHELTQEQPVMYAQTSGTTDKPKYIPVTKTSLEFHKLNQGIFTWLQYRANPTAFSGQLLGFAGAAVEGHFNNGLPFGSISGVMYKSMPAIAKAKFVIPYPVFEIDDYDLKYLLIARLALAEKDVTYLAAANPSTLLRLLSVMRQHSETLVADIEAGTFSAINKLPKHVIKAIQPKLKPDTIRAWEIQSLPDTETINYASIWPNLQMVVTWTGGSCGIALDTLRGVLPDNISVYDLGYVSTEFFGSITINSGVAQGLPTLYANVFEFIERNDWDNGIRETLGLDQLVQGKEYQVVITTASGLYRYFMNDILRVTGFVGTTPLLAFIQKGKGVTSICGEKLYESQVIQAVQAVCRDHSITISFYLMIADKQSSQYTLYYETATLCAIDEVNLTDSLDKHLRKINLEYDTKRHSKRLIRAKVALLSVGTGESCKQFYVAQGRREQQFKIMIIQYSDDLDFPVIEYCTH